MKYFLIFIIFSVVGFSCNANERDMSRYTSLKGSEFVAVVIKIAGRVNCSSINGYGNLPLDENCFGNYISEDLNRFNNNTDKEKFLILKVLKGKLKTKQVVEVDYNDIGDYRGLKFGIPYLIFFHEKNKRIFFEPCDVIEYSSVSSEISSNLSVDELIDNFIGRHIFNCVTLEASFP